MSHSKTCVHVYHSIIALVLVTSCCCHEKTLRKIVRGNQFRMVQRPFSDISEGIFSLRSNTSTHHRGGGSALQISHNYQSRHRLPTIISSGDNALRRPTLPRLEPRSNLHTGHRTILSPDDREISSAFEPFYTPTREEDVKPSEDREMTQNIYVNPPAPPKDTYQTEERRSLVPLPSSSNEETRHQYPKKAWLSGENSHHYISSEIQHAKTAIITKKESEIRHPKIMESYEDMHIQYPKPANNLVSNFPENNRGNHQEDITHHNRDHSDESTNNEYVLQTRPRNAGSHQIPNTDISHKTSALHHLSTGRTRGVQLQSSKTFKSHEPRVQYHSKNPYADNQEKTKSREFPQGDFFHRINSHHLHSIEQTVKKDGLANTYRGLPIHVTDAANKTISNSVHRNSGEHPEKIAHIKFDPSDLSDERPDFTLEEIKEFSELSYFNHNTSGTIYRCKVLQEIVADIDIQEKFVNLHSEPAWCTKKTFWNTIFDSRYEALMRNPTWPHLKVILIPRSHVETIAVKTFEQYHANSVNRILSNLVKKLTFYSNLTFSWNEVSHLSYWWKKTSHKNRSNFRRLVKSGRLEITTGGWVEPDEATSNIFGLVHQLVEGHQWLKANLNYSPQVAWLTASVTHSPTMVYLLSASDIHYLTFTHVHHAWEQFLAEYQFSDFLWLQNWDEPTSLQTSLNQVLNKIGHEKLPKNAVLTHFLQFNSDDFKACGPNHRLCTTEFNFTKFNKNMGINAYNVKDKAEALLEQYSKAGTLTPNNLVMAPIGGPFHYESQSEFDYQYDNYKKLADFINSNQDIYKATLQFGVAKDYFSLLPEMQKSYPTVKGDLLNYADITSGRPAFWVGFFTTRPALKILLRRLQSTLRTTEILFTFAVSYKAFAGINTTQIVNLLLKARVIVARLCDRNVLGGTLSMNALKSVYNQIVSTVKDCWNIQEVAASLMSSKSNLLGETSKVYLQKYVYREGEFMSVFRSVEPGDAIYIFNSLSHMRTEVIELVSMKPNLRILDHNNNAVTIQLSPIWKYSSRNLVKISKRYFKIVFIVVIPPMTLQLFRIKKSVDTAGLDPILICSKCVLDQATHEQPAAAFPFVLRSIEPGDIQLESYRHRLIFEESTGFLKTVQDKKTNKETKVVLNYGAFRSSHENAGMHLFNSNRSRPIEDVLEPYWSGKKTKIILIVCGLVSSEITVIFGNFLQHTVRVYNLPDGPLSSAIYVESKVDYGPPPMNRELELFMSIQTNIENGMNPELHTDNNGFQYTRRVLNMSEGLEPNIYPITSMVFIQDHRSRMTVLTDHAQGVAGLQEGQLTLMLDRRILYNDRRGPDEGLSDSSATCHRHFIILEDIKETVRHPIKTINLPSLSSVYLSNSMNYHIDVFLINKNQTHLCSQTYFHFITAPFPCDVSVLNFRMILKKGIEDNEIPNSALMILHRQGFSCVISYDISLNCEGNPEVAIDKLLRNVKIVYKTNLCGTSNGELLKKHEQAFLPSMELGTLKIYFN